MLSSQVIFSSFPTIQMSFLSDTPILLIILIIFFVLYSIVSMALLYHWSEYGMHSGSVLLAKTIFVFVSVVLFTVSFLTLNYF
jgi:hypothetical protein